MELDPFAAPTSTRESTAPVPREPPVVFDGAQVVVTSLLCNTLCGAALCAVNRYRAGEPGHAMFLLLAGAGWFVAYVTSVQLLGYGALLAVIPGAVALNWEHHALLREHPDVRPTASNAQAAGIAIVVAGATAAIMSGVDLLLAGISSG